jgi:hypothetical protein
VWPVASGHIRTAREVLLGGFPSLKIVKIEPFLAKLAKFPSDGKYSFSTVLVHIEALALDRNLRKRGTTGQYFPWHIRVAGCVSRSSYTSLFGNLVRLHVLTCSLRGATVQNRLLSRVVISWPLYLKSRPSPAPPTVRADTNARRAPL